MSCLHDRTQTTALPWFYWLIFGLYEPLLAISGFIGALFDPKKVRHPPRLLALSSFHASPIQGPRCTSPVASRCCSSRTSSACSASSTSLCSGPHASISLPIPHCRRRSSAPSSPPAHRRRRAPQHHMMARLGMERPPLDHLPHRAESARPQGRMASGHRALR
ncbi:hypothetical protein C8Q80DRAFT_1153693 [Daedaleopsis nitida]|nr:hypothetical protein C8Q80DRAFT_1153693 [Daedaleopsis nitida]